MTDRTDHGAVPRFDAGLVEVAPGVHAWLTPNGEWGESNAGLVVGTDAAAVVDTQWDLAHTRRFLDAARAAVGVPLTTLVNTHGDGDHTWGNELLAGAEIVATEAAAEQMADDPPAGLARFRAVAPILRRAGALPVPVVGSLGLPLLPRVPLRSLGRYVGAMLGPYDFSGIEPALPTRTFRGELSLSVGGREIALREVAPAHTAADLVVHVPDARVVFAGDVLFVGVHPVMWAGPTASWIAALDVVAELAPDVVVPGHGPVASLDDVAVLRAYLGWVEEAAVPRLEAGASVRETARGLLLDDLDIAMPWAAWDQPERLVITVATIDRHRRGVGGDGVGPVERARLFASVATLADELRG